MTDLRKVMDSVQKLSARFDSIRARKDAALYPFADLTASQIDRKYQQLSQQSSKLSTEMINAGRGEERPSETRGKNDELSRRVNEHSDQWNDIVREIRRREKYSGKHKPLPEHARQSFYGG